MVNYATGLMKLVDVEVIEKFSEMVYVVQFGCDEWLYCYVYRRWKIRGASHFGHLECVCMNCRFVERQIKRFTKKDFCLIKGLCCDEPYDAEVEPSNIRLLIKYFPQKFGFVGESSKGKGRDKGKGKVVKRKGRMKTGPKKATKKVSVTCAELETTFKQCEDEDAALKMGLVTVSMNLEYLDLVHDMDRFNTYSWGVILFE
ncbi:unnamed protein product [Malus baccata var. baccata]